MVLAKAAATDQQQRALSSISVFAFNRARLVQARTNLLTILRYQAEDIREEREGDQQGFSSSQR